MEAASAFPNFSGFVQPQRPSSQPLDAFFLSASSPSFLGSRSMMSFEDAHQAKGPNRPFFQSFNHEDNIEDELDDYFHQPEKKRRLTIDQVKFLEKSFEVENKLEPERKIQLAKDLGLQPRQITIWFQNRRARWKTKQLEMDYNTLQSSYNTLKADYETLLKDTDKLKSEVNLLSEKLLNKEKGNSGLCDKDTKPLEQTEKVISDSGSKDSVVVCKQEDLSSAKSDIFDSDSLYTDGVHSSLLEAGESSYVFEQDQSDLSQDEDDNLSKNLLPAYVFPKLEDVDYYASFEDQNFWTWSY